MLPIIEMYKICIMDDHFSKITRRSFLKLVGANLAAAVLRFPGDEEFWRPQTWPTLEMEDLTPAVREILLRVPRTRLAADGYLELVGKEEKPLGRVPLACTKWNQERNQPIDRLRGNRPWGIVLHWFGDKDNFMGTVAAYMRGFDSLRPADNYITRTSAHFLVGEETPTIQPARKDDHIGILQTQAPDVDGHPFLASHLQPLDRLAHIERRNYFVRAYYQLEYQEKGVHSLLQDFFDGPKIDPNLSTVAIEITGYDFEHPKHFPSTQQIANVISVVWAVMRRYRISANNILGHHEIQLGKADPGKKFMALIRYLLGVKALVEKDYTMMHLVFGQFLDSAGEPEAAVRNYFKLVRDYLVLVGTQRDVYEWEVCSNYWINCSRLMPGKIAIARSFQLPLDELQYSHTLQFLDPENHEGVDLLGWSAKDVSASVARSANIHLMSEGVCLYTGENHRCHPGQTALFSHIQPDGAQVLSVFGNLNSLGNLRVGELYPTGYPVGTLESSRLRQVPSLHFAIAYGATWDTDLKVNPNIPINAGTSWIQARYQNPLEVLQRHA